MSNEADGAPVALAGAPPRAAGAGPSARRRGAAVVAAALGVALLAVVFRCWRLDTVPPGLYVDEVLTARNALAWRLEPEAGLLGARPLLIPGWVETSHLYLAFASAVLALGGDGLLGIRLVSILPSLVAVPLLFWLARGVADRRTALLAAALLACSHWAARSGRTGWDAVLMVTLQLAALACLVDAQRRGRIVPAAVAGALAGLSLYTYVAAQLAVIHALLWLTWEVYAARPREDAMRRLLAFAAAAAAVAAPLLLRLGGSAGLASVRAAQLSILTLEGPGEPWRTLGRNVGGHLLMFNLRGGAYARDALPGFPMLDPTTGLLFLAGVVVLSWRRARPELRLLLSWPLVMALGGILSTSGEGPPYPYRVLSLAPWACLVAAIGGIALWDAARARLAIHVRGALPAATLLAIVLANGWVLFVAGPADPGSGRVYGTAATRLGRWLADHRGDRPAILLPGSLRSPPLPPGYRYAAANRTDFFRPADEVAAAQLAAGIYRHRPWRAVDPLRPAGDVDFVPTLPARLTGPTLLVLPPEQEAAAERRFLIVRRAELRHADGSPLARILLAAP
jgi:hypothetical protein